MCTLIPTNLVAIFTKIRMLPALINPIAEERLQTQTENTLTGKNNNYNSIKLNQLHNE